MRFFPGMILKISAILPFFALTLTEYAHATATYGTQTVSIQLGNTTASSFNASPTVGVAFANGSGFGAATNFTLDTGSTGVIVGPSLWTPPDGTPNLGAGAVTYSSSGVTHTGTWYQATLLVGDANGNNVTVQVPVLRVDPTTCTTDCTTAMFGVGFARESANNTQGPGGTQRAVPANNPLLNISAVNGTPVTASTPNQPGVAAVVNGTLTSGYIISPLGLTVGLTTLNTSAFSMVPLTWNNQMTTAGYADWNPAPSALTVNGVSGTGTVLNDTGITYAMVSMPGSGAGTNTACGYQDCLDNGIGVAVAIPQAAGAAAAYSYTVGGTNTDAAAPPYTRLVVDGVPFVNTGLPFFNQFTYLYDYVNGNVGYLDRTTPEGAPADFVIVHGVPGPAPLGLLGFGLAALAAVRRRRG